MARAIDRVRCTDRGKNPFSRPIKSGTSFGRFVFGVRPRHRHGTRGHRAHRDECQERRLLERHRDHRADGRRRATGEPLRRADHFRPPPIRLACYTGLSCFPSGGSAALGGDLDLAFQVHHTSLANLVLTTSGTAPNALHQTLTGTLDGATVTVVTKRAATAGHPASQATSRNEPAPRWAPSSRATPTWRSCSRAPGLPRHISIQHGNWLDLLSAKSCSDPRRTPQGGDG